MENKQNEQNKQERLEEKAERLTEDANLHPERTEQEEDIISPKADTDLVEGDIKNDAVLAGEEGNGELFYRDKEEPKKMNAEKTDDD